MGWLSVPRKLILVVIIGILVLIPSAISQTPLSVSVSTNEPQYVPGETVAISGMVHDSQNNPVPGATVSIEVDDPGGKPVHVQAPTSDQSGAFADSFILPSTSSLGQYTVYATASKSGYVLGKNQAYFTVQTTTSTASSSSSTSTSNLPRLCLIATAAYGSELAPEVVILRRFRDSDVLQTSAGTSFMQAFNAFYYSFSPQVASFISSQNTLREAVRIYLYPLIGILYLSSSIFSASSFNGEIAVIVSGIFASAGLGFVYVGPIVAILGRIRRAGSLSRYSKAIRATFVIQITSLVGLVLAEVVQATQLLTVAAVLTVLSWLALGGFVLPWILESSRRTGSH